MPPRSTRRPGRPARRIRAICAAMLAVGVSLMAAAPASAVPKEFFGVISLEHPSASEFNTLGRGRVGTLRFLLYWPTVEPTPGQRVWAPYDALVENAARNGIRVMPTIFGSPGFAAGRTQAPPSPAARGAFAQFVGDAVARYGNGGTFWQQNPGVPTLPITHWQLWNEVSSPSFWSKKPSPKKYGKLLKLTSRTIRGRDPAADVVLAGLFTRPMLKRAILIEDYLDGLYEVNKIKKFFDAVAVHPYATKPADAIRAVRKVRKVLKQNKDGRTPIWITEAGWASGGERSRFNVGPAGQAANLESLFSSLSAKSASLGIAGVIWYSLRDHVAPDWIFNTGLFEANGSPKPAWSSFVRFTGGTP